MEDDMRIGWAVEMAEMMATKGLTPLHLADDHESLLRYQLVLAGDVLDIPGITLLRMLSKIRGYGEPPRQVMEDDGALDDHM
ncbi:hypothetical protein [Rhizobium laguerreae]|uniref:hypothetical protein n=1 Tax=Rhizobium laguerreae TaxID=1076926 RepID=UPI001C92357A|nr:hypothetical protein [Rhizobium laguerreae]MBY3314765.1 hypothetical protein [Rhizobium laguerreae]